ncbi:hypothetical protein chiPu_0024490, partial [Chiloscyllium punctatum]|nr:hypothetical protein [Chiloscyllium punctatum]
LVGSSGLLTALQLTDRILLLFADSMVDDMDVDLDREFLQDLKDLKVLITDKDLLDQHKSLVCTALRGKVSTFSEMEANFKVRGKRSRRNICQ